MTDTVLYGDGPPDARLDVTLVTEGQPMPLLSPGDLICGALRNRQDIFLVRRTDPLTVGSVLRREALVLGPGLDEVRPLAVVRNPHHDLYPLAKEGDILQDPTSGRILRVQGLRWVDHTTSDPVLLPLFPTLILRERIGPADLRQVESPEMAR